MELDPTSKLGAFFEETKDDSPDVRAEKLEAHKAISEVHDEVAKQGQTSVSVALKWWFFCRVYIHYRVINLL